MRKTVFLTLFAAATFLAPASASAVPGAFGDQAAISRDLGATVLEGVAYRAKAKHKRYAKKYPRRYDWSYYPIGGRTSIATGNSTTPTADRCSNRLAGSLVVDFPQHVTITLL